LTASQVEEEEEEEEEEGLFAIEHNHNT